MLNKIKYALIKKRLSYCDGVLSVQGLFNKKIINEYKNILNELPSHFEKNYLEVNLDLAHSFDTSSLGMLLLLRDKYPDCVIRIKSKNHYFRQLLILSKMDAFFRI